MDLKLNNKVAVVLAASKGLGRATATALSAEGAKVIIGSRDEAELNKTAAAIRKLTGNEVIVIPVDVSKADEIEEFVEDAAAKFGRIDILLNNAGGPPFDKFENFDDGQWQKAFELNLLSVARLSKLVLPHMQKTGSGRIINIISGSVKAVLGNSVLSTTMRMGVVGMAKLMADEFGPYNITVNNVAPGLNPYR
jgi:3-oxoacyl-[acyl-carrier protein] reductase